MYGIVDFMLQKMQLALFCRGHFRNGFLFFIIIFSTFNICISAFAGTFFVGQNSAGSGDGSSYENRMSISSHNNKKFAPGDQIYICDLVTSEIIVPSSGAFDKPITYRGDFINHKGIIDRKGGTNALTISNRDHVTISSLEIRNAQEGIVSRGNNDGIVIKKCFVHDIIYRGMFFANSTDGYRSGSSKNIIIGGKKEDGNEIKNVGMNTAGGDIVFGASVDGGVISYNHLWADRTDKGIDGIVLEKCKNIIVEYNEIHGHNDSVGPNYGENAIDMKNASYVVFRFNEVYDHQHEGNIIVQWDSRDIDIYGNKIYNAGIDANIIVMDGVYGTGAPPMGTGVKNVNIWSNIIHDGPRGIWVSGCCGSDYDHVEPVGIYNNLIANHSETGILISSGALAGHSLINNIFKANGSGATPYHVIVTSSRYLDTLNHNNFYYSESKSYIKIGSNSFRGADIDNNYELEPAFRGDNYNFHIDQNNSLASMGLNLGQKYSCLLSATTSWEDLPPYVNTTSQEKEGNWIVGPYGYSTNISYSISPPQLEVID